MYIQNEFKVEIVLVICFSFGVFCSRFQVCELFKVRKFFIFLNMGYYFRSYGLECDLIQMKGECSGEYDERIGYLRKY